MIKQHYLSLFKALDNGEQIIVPSHRLARELDRYYSQWKAGQGIQAWPSAQINVWEDWVKSLWFRQQKPSYLPSDNMDSDTSISSRQANTVLNTQQRYYLIRDLIETRINTNAEFAMHSSIDIDDINKAVINAWKASNEWNLNYKLLGNFDKEARFFQAIIVHYLKALQKNQWVDENTLIDKLIDVKFDVLHLSAVYLFGFEQLTHQQRRAMSYLEECGITVAVVGLDDGDDESIDDRGTNKIIKRHQFETKQAEFTAIAKWCKQQLETDSKKKIAVVVGNLSANQHDIARAFESQLLPQSMIGLNKVDHKPYHIFPGPKLAQVAEVAAVLNLLSLFVGEFEYEDFSAFLRSPHFQLMPQSQAHIFDRECREQLPQNMTLKSLCANLIGKDKFAPYQQSILKIQTHYNNLGSQHSFSDWSQWIGDLLKDLNWSGYANNVFMADIQSAWNKVFDEVASLALMMADRRQKKLQLSQLMSHISRVCNERSFQFHDVDAPIQILDVKEAIGLSFDCLWFASADSKTWPLKKQALTFFPFAMQYQCGNKKLNTEGMFEYCLQLQQQLFHHSDEVIVSYHRMSDDLELKISPLLRDLADASDDKALENIESQHDNDQSEYFDSVMDQAVPLIFEDPQQPQLKSGGSVLRSQLSCPFQAFARYRLLIDKPDVLSSALEPRYHGTILHDVLELFWKQTQNQAKLLQMSDEQINDALKLIIDKSIKAHAHDNADPQMQGLYAQTIIHLIKQWLDFEKGRAPFEVLKQEQAYNVTIAGVNIATRFDRVDKIYHVDEQGHCDHIIIDYKTGSKIALSALASDPLEEPQLGLYWLGLGEPDYGVAYARVRWNECGLDGLSNYEGHNIGAIYKNRSKVVKQYESVEELGKHWKKQLESAMTSFTDGFAGVDPTKKACQYCELKPACRISELKSLNLDDNDDEYAEEDYFE